MFGFMVKTEAEKKNVLVPTLGGPDELCGCRRVHRQTRRRRTQENPQMLYVAGMTGHTEVVRVVFHPDKISFANLLKVFWESHNPTQGMRQGNDIGTTYRSAIYTYTQQQLEEALASKDQYQKVLSESGFGPITTEIAEAKPFYYAEDYHQQYLNKIPDGYCGLKGTGVSCPTRG